MEYTSIDAELFAKLFLAGAKRLEANKDIINELNVFPVPDGDTGINMTMTIMSAAKEVAAIDKPDMATLCKAISGGSLRGARGNSGVILSQLFRGFTKVIKKEEILTVPIICEAFQKSVETAYRAVMKPKEGTILTVARAAADKALELVDSTDDIVVFAEAIVEEAKAVLERTPDMLPVLKQAGVVDAGGQGLVEVLSGVLDLLNGKEIDLSLEGAQEKQESEEYKFLYELSLKLSTLPEFSAQDEADIKVYLESIADQLNLTKEKEALLVSLLTNEPGRAINKVLKHGSISNVSLTNLRDDKGNGTSSSVQPVPESSAAEATPSIELIETSEEPKDVGFVTVSIGDGLNQIFKDLGADAVIAGGQTMNPSTEDILSAVEKVNAPVVFVLPNNKNIILAANQARDLCKDKKVIVLPTKTIPQGISAMINYIPDQTPEDNEANLIEELKYVASGEVTYAVRDTTIDDKEIKAGDYMGIGDAGILAVDKEIDEVMIKMLSEMITDESAIITLYYGEDVKKKDAKNIAAKVMETYPSIEVELQKGGQPVYFYVVSVE